MFQLVQFVGNEKLLKDCGQFWVSATTLTRFFTHTNKNYKEVLYDFFSKHLISLQNRNHLNILLYYPSTHFQSQ